MRRILLLLTTIFFLLSNALAQPNKLDTSLNAPSVSIPTKIIVDTLRVQSFDIKGTQKVWYEDENMPWIIALTISILGILINLIISNSQIKANQETTLKQIKATLNTNNRQAWVNETRNALTDLITQTRLLNIEFQEKLPNFERKKMIHEKVTQSRIKLLLLLNPEKEYHKELIEVLKTFINTLDEHLLNSNSSAQITIPYDNFKFMSQSDAVIECGRKLLYNEWDKIQSII